MERGEEETVRDRPDPRDPGRGSMSGVDGLVARYAAFLSLRWEESGGPPQRVWFAVYDPGEERRLRARLGAFEAATVAAGLAFRRCDLARVFSAWLGSHRYRDAYLRAPLELRGALSELREAVIAAVRSALSQAGEAEVAALTGLGSLLGLVSVTELVDALREAVACRLLVFFPGSYEAGSFRFLEARGTFVYPAAVIAPDAPARPSGRGSVLPAEGGRVTGATVIEALAAGCARAARAEAGQESAAAAVLWPDRERRFEGLLSRAGSAWPGLLVLGDLDGRPEQSRRGPSLWLRCRVDRTVAGPVWPAGTVPVVYLPGVAREQLRASEDAPWTFQLLADLRFRGVVFEREPGVDWSLHRLLSDRVLGPGLDLPREEPVRAALEKVAVRLGAVPLERLRGRRLTAEDLFDAVVLEPAEAVLSFLDDPRAFRNGLSEGEWDGFRSLVSRHFDFDPGADGPKEAAALLARRGGTWAHAWELFEKDPARFRGVAALLEKFEPRPPDPSFHESSWPGTNRREEAALRADLLSLATLPAGKARALLPGLSAVHRRRRSWVWAKLGRSPLASALSPLGRLAKAAARPVLGSDARALGEAYASGGWEVDAFAAEALALVESPADADAVDRAARSLAADFVEEGARRLAEVLAGGAVPATPHDPPLFGECVVVVPSLSYPAGQMLRRSLEPRGLTVTSGWSWAGHVPWADRESLAERRIQLLGPEETGAPSGRAVVLVERLAPEEGEGGAAFRRRQSAALEALAERLAALVAAGWARVRVVSDAPSPSSLAGPSDGASPAPGLGTLVVPVLSVEPGEPEQR